MSGMVRVDTERPAFPHPEAGGFGMAVAFGILLVAQVASVVWVVGLVQVIWGSDQITALSELPMWALPLLNVGLWLVYGLGPILYRRTVGWSVWDRVELGLTLRQAGFAAAVGVGLQVVVLPVLYWFLGRFFTSDPSESARALVDRVDGPVDVGWLVLSVLVMAPLLEEWFFRGLLLPALAHHVGVAGSIVGSSVIFALVHQTPIVLPGLFVVGVALALLVRSSGRIGPAIVAHLCFNAVTVVQLLVL